MLSSNPNCHFSCVVAVVPQCIRNSRNLDGCFFSIAHSVKRCIVIPRLSLHCFTLDVNSTLEKAVVAGILIGPYCLGRLGIPGIGFTSSDDVSSYAIISNVALGFIAVAMGNEFRLSELKKTGKQAVVVAIFQALVATIAVDVSLFVVHLFLPDKLPLPCVLTLGAIATATAPAATLMVVKQYKADGRA